MFAVRQWPGNMADLDFRGVLQGCTAAIVSSSIDKQMAAPLLRWEPEKRMTSPAARDAFLVSDQYAAAAKVLPFARLWYVRPRHRRRRRRWVSPRT